MTDTINIYIDYVGETRLVGRCRYVAKRRGQSSVFEYADEWRGSSGAFALDPANLPLEEGQIYTSTDKSARRLGLPFSASRQPNPSSKN